MSLVNPFHIATTFAEASKGKQDKSLGRVYPFVLLRAGSERSQMSLG